MVVIFTMLLVMVDESSLKPGLLDMYFFKFDKYENYIVFLSLYSFLLR